MREASSRGQAWRWIRPELTFALSALVVLPLGAQAQQTDDAPPEDAAPAADGQESAEALNAGAGRRGGSTAERRSVADAKVFRDGLEAFYGDDFKAAAARMYDYLSTNEETAENHAWSKYFLGVALARMGFGHGAAEYLFEVANDRVRPEILPDTLNEIEALMAGPHDEALLDRRLIVDTDFGYLPNAVAGFVRYHQGLADLRAGRREWAERLFGAIPTRTRYSARADYALGVAFLDRDQLPEAVARFRAALDHPYADRETRNLSRLALARVLYEKKAYAAAEAMYLRVEVPELTAAEGEILLERAWTAYWRDDHRTAMGLLYALEAPSYRELYAPEKFLLRALIYQRLCHYIPAKRAVRRFGLAYGPTLDHIRKRRDLRESAELRRGARAASPMLRRLVEHRRALAAEARRIDDVGGAWRETGLDDRLREIYQLAAEEADLELSASLEAATRDVAAELVLFEEQMFLLDYEVGLSIYQRIREEQARRDKVKSIEIPWGGPDAVYPFVDEYWNDELANYDFLITSRCFAEGAPE